MLQNALDMLRCTCPCSWAYVHVGVRLLVDSAYNTLIAESKRKNPFDAHNLQVLNPPHADAKQLQPLRSRHPVSRHAWRIFEQGNMHNGHCVCNQPL